MARGLEVLGFDPVELLVSAGLDDVPVAVVVLAHHPVRGAGGVGHGRIVAANGAPTGSGSVGVESGPAAPTA